MCADFADGERKDEMSTLYADWVAAMKAYGLSFHFEALKAYTDAYEAAGLSAIDIKDNTKDSAIAAHGEITFLTGQDVGPLRDALGEEKFVARIQASTMRYAALDAGALLHVHMFATKPE